MICGGVMSWGCFGKCFRLGVSKKECWLVRESW